LQRALSPAYRPAALARLKLPERTTAVALLVLLHAALLFLINPQFRLPTAPQVNEITLSFSRVQPREAPPPAINPVLMRPNAPPMAPPVIPQSNLPSVLQAPLTAPDIGGVGRSLFNCDLGNSGNMPPEERANCLNFGATPPASGSLEAGMPKNSKAKHGAIWAAELSARRTPPEVPCTSLQQQVFGGAGIQKPVTTLMADPLCLLNGLLNGFQAQTK
jgi:hypothetical protein